MRKSDRIASLLLLAICAFLFIEAKKFSPLSALFPRVVLGILAALSLLLFFLSFLRKKDGGAFDAAAFRHVPTLLSLAMMVVWGLLIPVVGFLVTSVVFFTAMTLYLDRKATVRKRLGRAGITVTVTVVFWLFFTKVLYVPFPQGILL